MAAHKLKTWPIFFEEIVKGNKNFEVRNNDRNFKVGDLLLLEEYDPDAELYTGRWCERRVTYIMDKNNPFIDLGDNVILSIK